MARYTIALDAGHGGTDPGATYNGRQEKDDTLRLTQAVGKILAENGIDVVYTRTNDIYETPFKKATDANESGADYFVSIHRNSSERPNQYQGVETLVYNDDGIRASLARNINQELQLVGFDNLGVDKRPNLVVLKRTKMPAVLVEAGFINSDSDNALFDARFDDIAQAIANGILKSLPDTRTTQSTSIATPSANTTISTAPSTATSESTVLQEPLYRVQTGAFYERENADRMLNSLQIEGFPAFILYQDGYYKVQVGAYRNLYNAIKMEQRLRRFRYNTYIVYN